MLGGKKSAMGIEHAYTDEEMYRKPEYIQRQESLERQANDPKTLEGKIKRLEKQLEDAISDIRAKESLIRKFESWQLGDKYLGEPQVQEYLEQQRGKSKEVHEREAKEMADAAAQMVKSLQEMLNNKND